MNTTSTNNPLKSTEFKKYVLSFPRGKQIMEEGVSYYSILQDKLLVSNAVKRGIPNNVFTEIKTGSPFSDQQWAQFLNINIRTLQRYKKDNAHVFKPNISERIFELAEVISLGNSIFDSANHFSLWLNTPNAFFDQEPPANLLDNSYGIALVIAELNRIEHGIFI